MYAVLLKKRRQTQTRPRTAAEAIEMGWWPKIIGTQPLDELRADDTVTVAFFPPKGEGIVKFDLPFGATPFCPIWKRRGEEILIHAKKAGWKITRARSAGVEEPDKIVKVFIEIPGTDDEIVLRCPLRMTPFFVGHGVRRNY